MRKRTEELCVLGILKILGGMATTSSIKQRMKKEGIDKVNVRAALRRLKRNGILKTDRPDDSKLQLRWEILREEATVAKY